MTDSDAIIKIDSLSYGPYGIGRREGQAILTPLTAPGDEVKIRVVERRRNYAVAEMQELLSASPLRQIPPCTYFGKCGGCSWQHVEYSAQLAAKEKNVGEALRRIGKLDEFEQLPIVRSPQEYGYRSRIRLQVDRQNRIGLYRGFSHEIIEIDSCRITDAEADRSLTSLREWIQRLKTRLRQVEIIRGDCGETVFLGEAEGHYFADDEKTSSSFLSRHKQISGLVLLGRAWRRSWGEDKISVSPENGIEIEAAAETFTQVNRSANRILVQKLLSWAEFQGQDRILELYSGAGNFTLPIARRSRDVLAVEANLLSVKQGEINGHSSGLQNIRWLCSPMPKAITQLAKAGTKFCKIVLNPPRSGAKGLEKDLASLGAAKIFYISCNPTTLARDLAGLKKAGYKLKRVQPIDLFPQTFHVETLAEVAAA